MYILYGELECKVDEKGRFLLPGALLRLLPEAEREEFVLNKNPDGCIEMWPLQEWNNTIKSIFDKNQFDPLTREYARRFQSGSLQVQLDKAGRLLIPKHLATYARIDKDIMVKGMGRTIEIWSMAAYRSWESGSSHDMAVLAQKVMGPASAHPNA